MRKGSLQNTSYEDGYRNKKEKTNMITKKNVIWMVVCLAICVFVIYQVYNMIMYTLGKKDQEEMWLYNAVNTVIGVAKDPSLYYDSEESTVKFAGIGDIYFTQNTIAGAYTKSGYDFVTGTETVGTKLKEFDLVTASLKTPIAGSNLGYSSGMVYNAPQSVVELLKSLNISAVATASSHAVDKNVIGVNYTIENLDDESIKHVGTSTESRKDPIIISKNNINIGVLSYTTESNVKMSAANSYILNIFDEEDLNKDMQFLKSKNVDFIVAYLNVPNENVTMVNSEQKQITEKLFNAGVDVVLGSGSMVVQESLQEVSDNGKQIYTIYSLGDLCGSYKTDDNRLSVIANIDFKKTVYKDKEGNIKDEKTSMNINNPIAVWTVINNSYSSKMYLLNDEISSYDKGTSNISASEYKKMKEAKDRIDLLFNN